MQKLVRCVTAVALVAVGYVMGASGVLSPRSLGAQTDELPPDTRDKLVNAATAVRDVAAELSQLERYDSVTNDVNFFSVSVGGIKAKDDLEKGRGVDPETFAALYADQAIDEIKQHLDHDDQGRLTYKGKVVRMYPISRLKRLYQLRAAFAKTESKKSG